MVLLASLAPERQRPRQAVRRERQPAQRQALMSSSAFVRRLPKAWEVRRAGTRFRRR
jgi:hypothetical protein